MRCSQVMQKKKKKTKQNIKLDLNKMFKSPFFQFSAIVLIYKVGLSEMFTSDAKKQNKTKKPQWPSL